MDKISKEKIKDLKAREEYEEIFREFGQKVYKKYVPHKYRKQDFKKLKREGKYEDIYNKYGKSKYNQLLVTAMYREIKDAKGLGPAVAWRIKEGIIAVAKSTGIYSMAALLTFSGVMSITSESSATENAETYKEEIKAYNEHIKEYSNSVNQYGFSDVQIFMKVMDDMWGSIKGYGQPEKDISGFLELDLATEEGFGVCRNMASDIARKLNEINPKYNARTMRAWMGEDGYYEIADIQRTFIETNQTIADNDNSQEKEQNLASNDGATKFIQNAFGNHMLTLVDVPEDNLTIVLDPTNPGIGIYINGKIIMLNSGEENGLEFEAKEYSNAIFTHGGIDGILTVASDYMRSFQKANLTFAEIQSKYGLEAQNKALIEVRARVAAEDTLKKIQTNDSLSFNEKYKVDLSEIDNIQTTRGTNSQINYDLEK